MECPRCHTLLLTSTERCPHCGLTPEARRALKQMEALRREVGRLGERVASEVKGLDARFREFSTQLAEIVPDTSVPLAAPDAPPPQDRTEPDASPAPAGTTDTGGAAIGKESTPGETPASKERPVREESAARLEPSGIQKEIGPGRERGRAYAREAKLAEALTNELKIGQVWMLIGGIVIMLLGIGYFLKYAFDRNWIGPWGRVMLVFLFGGLLLGGGDRFRRRGLASFGLSLAGAGLATLYFAGYAAFQVYGLVSQPLAFAFMILITALSGGLALAYDAKAMATLGLFGGFLTPVMLRTGHDNQIALMSYMAILNAGVLGLSFFKRWTFLQALGFLFTWFLFAGWYSQHYTEAKFATTLLYLNLFYLMYHLAPAAYGLRRDGKVSPLAVGLTLLNGLIAMRFSVDIVRAHASPEWASLPVFAYALLAVGLGRDVHRRIGPSAARSLFLAQGVLFAVIAASLLFSRYWITNAWGVLALVTLVMAVRLDDILLGGSALVLLALTLLRFFCYDLVSSFDLDFGVIYAGGWSAKAAGRLFSEALMVTLPWMFARFLRKGPACFGETRADYRKAGWALFGLVLFLVLNIETATWAGEHAPRIRFAAISVLWAVYASTMIVIGFIRNVSELRRSAMVLFTLTILKVFLVDMQNVDVPYRILSFLILGMLLIGGSYLYHRYRNQISPPPPGEST